MAAKPILPQHQEFLDDHFGIAPQWKSFHKKLRGKKFGDAVMQDTRSDRKLKRFVKMVGLRQQSKQRGLPAVGDSGKKYRIKYHPEAKRFSCSCKDWTYKRSVRNRGKGGDCKHINRMNNAMKQGLTKLGLARALVRLGRGMHREEKMRDNTIKAKIEQKAYKIHFPRPSLAQEWIFGKTAEARAVAIGKAAGEIRHELRLRMQWS